MGITIYPIHLGTNVCYLIRDRGIIMVDGGLPNRGTAFQRAIAKIPIHRDQIRLIVLTHGHFDHVGSAGEIKAITGAQIAIHRQDKHYIEAGVATLPPELVGVGAWGRLLRLLLKALAPLLAIPACEVDLTLDDEGLSLDEYGIAGKVIHTPGHSPGSVSVLLETGEAFVGCLAHNNLPFRLRPGLPIFAEDLEQLNASWRSLLDQGARVIYPAHGNPFSVDAIREAIS